MKLMMAYDSRSADPSSNSRTGILPFGFRDKNACVGCSLSLRFNIYRGRFRPVRWLTLIAFLAFGDGV